jgi:hypothetical protein
MEAALKSQVLKKTNIPCLYRSSDSGIFYGIFTRKGDQVKKSLKTTDKELVHRCLEPLRQKVARLNTKVGRPSSSLTSPSAGWTRSVAGWRHEAVKPRAARGSDSGSKTLLHQHRSALVTKPAQTLSAQRLCLALPRGQIA